MRLNTIKPGVGAKKKAKRLGRGIGSGVGKTSGHGHKGQKARAGGYHKVGFEGGQMPLHRRIPKFGFTSRKAMVTAEIRLPELEKVEDEVVTLESLKKAHIISDRIKYAKIILSGELKKAVTVKGLKVTKGAKMAIEAAGGSIKE